MGQVNNKPNILNIKKEKQIEMKVETIVIDNEINDTNEINDINVITDTRNNHDIRGEERWHASINSLVCDWRDQCVIQSRRHDIAGNKARTKHIVFGLPAPITSIVTACVAGLWVSPDAVFFILPATALATVFSVVHVFFDMGGKAEKHWGFSARYGGVASKIDLQLARDVDFRRPADEFMAETGTEINNLNANAPQLSGKGWCSCSKCYGKDGVPLPGLETNEELERRRIVQDRRKMNFIESNENDSHINII